MVNKLIVTPEHPKGFRVALTAEEEAQRVTDVATEQTANDAREAEATQKAIDKTNGNQKLLDLGLTQAEVYALTGK